MGFTENLFLFVFLPISLLLSLAVNRMGKPQIRNTTYVLMSVTFYALASIETLAFMCAIVLCAHYMGLIIATPNQEKTGVSGKNGGVFYVF